MKTDENGKAETGTLSIQEARVLECFADGLTKKETAAKMGISAGTVGTYTERAFRKLGVHNRAAAVGRYYRAKFSRP